MNKIRKFINLYMQTEYSLLSSMIRIDNLGKKLSDYEYSACAITDTSMYGTLKFYRECLSHRIKPIIGLKLKIYNKQYNNYILLYAMNKIGYHNLMSLSTEASVNEEGLTIDAIIPYSYGVIAIIPSDENEIVQYYLNNAFDKSKNLLDNYKKVFRDIYFGFDFQTNRANKYADELLEFCKLNEILPVAINCSLYFNDHDIEAYQVLKALGSGKDYVPTEKELNCSLLTSLEGQLLFQNHPDLLDNTLAIANKCQVEIEFNVYHLPSYNITNSHEYLSDLCKIGLNKRLNKKSQLNQEFNVDVYRQRLLYELEVIEKMGFTDYFLVVYDYVRFAKTNDIFVGPGRGSSGASLVCYAIGITDIDPIEHQLLFERFLNVERISMPDIDVDFPDDRRDEVIKYLGDRFGKTRVAHITTFGTMKARLAVRDVARVMGLSELKLKAVLKHIPPSYGPQVSSLKVIINGSNELNQLFVNDEEINRLLSVSLKIEGMPRNCSTHAAGIVMADKELTSYTPLQSGINGLYQTQYDAGDLESLGLVKMDVLGIRNLTIIKNVLHAIFLKTKEQLNIREIPLNDKKTYEAIAKGNTLGIFQLESDGVRKLLIDMKCSEFMDIVNATSLYRPGPMEMIPEFIKRKRGMTYKIIHPDLKDILNPTYGIIVYQEQILLIAQKFAGYSLGSADVLRRAVSKKKANILEEERYKFVNSSKNKGYNEQLANEVYDYIEKFANYGFNKNHAVAYGMVAYWMAYLKTHYYIIFMTALLSNSIGDVNSIIKYFNECKNNKVSILVPNINISDTQFVYDDNGIYFPLTGIANVGDVIAKNILQVRNQGLFVNYEDFVFRTHELLNKRQVMSLIHSGALDCFNLSRRGMIEAYDNLEQMSVYRFTLGDKLVKYDVSGDEYTFEEISALEKEAIGFNIKYSMFIKYQNYRQQEKTININELTEQNNIMILFVVRSVREITTKNNERMAFLDIYDDSGEIGGVIFPKTFKTLTTSLIAGRVYSSNCKVERRDGTIQAILNTIYNLD